MQAYGPIFAGVYNKRWSAFARQVAPLILDFYSETSTGKTNKSVLDLGCGTGRLAIGALLMGAKEVVGVDTDYKVLEIAEENLHSIIPKSLAVKGSIRFLRSDIENFSGRCDTVIQNPPFGIQSLHADRAFIEKALECGKSIYSLHKDGYEKTREFLTKFIESKGGKVEQIIPYKFSIPHMFRFHKKPKKELSVDLYMIKKIE